MYSDEAMAKHLSYAPERVTEEEFLRLQADMVKGDFLDLGPVDTAEGPKRRLLYRGETKQGRAVHTYTVGTVH